jgi:hypothetical protein
MEDFMSNRVRLGLIVVAIAVGSSAVVWSQGAQRTPPQSPYLAAPNNLVLPEARVI